MATWMKVTGACAAAAVLIAALWWWPLSGDGAFDARGNAEGVRSVVANVAPDAPSAAREAADAAVSSPSAVGEATGTARVQGRVVDAETKLPLAGAMITLSRTFGARPEPADLAYTAQADGTFAVDVPSAWQSPRLWFRADAHLAACSDLSRLDAGQHDELGDVALAVGRRLHGRIVDDLGLPLPAGTTLHASFASSGAGLVQQFGWADVPVGDEGVFCFDAVPIGSVEFDLDRGDHELSQKIVVTASEPRELALTARSRQRITGVLVDRADTPLAGVLVAAFATGLTTTTSADGSFVLLRPNRWGPSAEVRVLHAPEFLVSHTKDVPWGTTGLRIVLQPAVSVPLVVVDDAGAPVEQYGIELMRDGMDSIERGAVLQRGAHAGGRLDVADVDPGLTSLRVVPVDDRLTPSAFVPIATGEAVRVVLVRRVSCTVAVALAGRPVAGARVETVFIGGPGPAFERLTDLLDPHRGARAWVSVGMPERVATARTDANGVATLLRDVDSAGRALQIHVDGRSPFLVREPTFPAHVELPGIGAIAGSVTLRGRHRSAAYVRLTGALNLLLTPQPDGTYRSPPLVAGTWRVGFAGIEASERDVDVRDGETTIVDFDFADHPPASVCGRLHRDGALPAGLTAELLRLVANSRAPSAGIAPVAADGTFTIGDLQAGTYRLVLRAAGASPLVMPAMLAETYVIAPGEKLQLDVSFPPRRLVVHLLGSDGLPVKGAKVLTRCGGMRWPTFAAFAQPVDDAMVLDPAPALPIEFAVLRNGAQVWSAPVVMPPDRSEAEVTVVLPD